MSQLTIDINNVYFNYNQNLVLKAISLKVYAGEFIGIIGPNGGGKTTLLKLILGLLQPTKGTIKKLSHTGETCATNRIGYVPQHMTFSQDFPVTAIEVVRMGNTPPWPIFSTNKTSSVAQQTMALLGIESIANYPISALSGGQLQSLLIARALNCQPEILIMDEPTANVDMRKQQDIFSLLKTYNQQMTVIIVSHDVGFISDYVDRVACLNQTLVCHNTESLDGKIIEQLYGKSMRLVAHHH